MSRLAMSQNLGGAWGTECLKTRDPVVLYTGYSVKLKKIFNKSYKIQKNIEIIYHLKV